MTIVRTSKDKNNPFVMINKNFLEDPTLSLRGKGLIAYCMTKPDGWQFNVRQMSTVLKEKKDTLYSIFDELIECGYCIRGQTRSKDGEFGKSDYMIFESKIQVTKNHPCLDFPDPVIPDPVIPDPDFPTHSNNIYSNNKNSDIEGATAPKPPSHSSSFSSINNNLTKKSESSSVLLTKSEADNSEHNPEFKSDNTHYVEKESNDSSKASETQLSKEIQQSSSKKKRRKPGERLHVDREDDESYGEFVRLIRSEYDELCQKYGKSNVDYKIKAINSWCVEKPKTEGYKNYFSELDLWLHKALLKGEIKVPFNPQVNAPPGNPQFISEEEVFKRRQESLKFIKEIWPFCQTKNIYIADKVNHFRIGNDQIRYDAPNFKVLVTNSIKKLGIQL